MCVEGFSMKRTVLGDILCEPPVLKASKKDDNTYDFNGVFDKVRPLLEEANYVIANLEFPMAGEDAKYTDCFFVFNAPDSYAVAAQNAGVDLVSTANNHTLDRGVEGMLRTLDALDAIGLAHTGTFRSPEKREEAYYFTVNGVRFAVIAYTYTCNEILKDDDPHIGCINFLRSPHGRTYLPEVWAKTITWVDKALPKMKIEHRARIKQLLGMPGTVERADDYLRMDDVHPYIDQMISDIKTAKEKADIVICYPHVGGQFNPKPGAFSEYVVNQAVEAGADAVLAAHSHMVQKAEFVNGLPCAFSLGNFSMSPNSAIIVKENLPEYGLAMHLYVEDKAITKVTYSILKAVEKRGSQLISWPIDELYAALKTEKQKEKLRNDVAQILQYVTGKCPAEVTIQREYEL